MVNLELLGIPAGQAHMLKMEQISIKEERMDT